MIPGRAYSKFQNMKLNPLCNWNKKKTEDWIDQKKKQFMNLGGVVRGEGNESHSDASD